MQSALEDEMHSMQQNGVWELAELPLDAKAIDKKWIFKSKLDLKRNVERKNVRLVGKGFTQR